MSDHPRGVASGLVWLIRELAGMLIEALARMMYGAIWTGIVIVVAPGLFQMVFHVSPYSLGFFRWLSSAYYGDGIPWLVVADIAFAWMVWGYSIVAILSTSASKGVFAWAIGRVGRIVPAVRALVLRALPSRTRGQTPAGAVSAGAIEADGDQVGRIEPVLATIPVVARDEGVAARPEPRVEVRPAARVAVAEPVASAAVAVAIPQVAMQAGVETRTPVVTVPVLAAAPLEAPAPAIGGGAGHSVEEAMAERVEVAEDEEPDEVRAPVVLNKDEMEAFINVANWAWSVVRMARLVLKPQEADVRVFDMNRVGSPAAVATDIFGAVVGRDRPQMAYRLRQVELAFPRLSEGRLAACLKGRGLPGVPIGDPGVKMLLTMLSPLEARAEFVVAARRALGEQAPAGAPQGTANIVASGLSSSSGADGLAIAAG